MQKIERRMAAIGGRVSLQTYMYVYMCVYVYVCVVCLCVCMYACM